MVFVAKKFREAFIALGCAKNCRPGPAKSVKAGGPAVLVRKPTEGQRLKLRELQMGRRTPSTLARRKRN